MQLDDLPSPVLQAIINNLDAKSVVELCEAYPKIQVFMSEGPGTSINLVCPACNNYVPYDELILLPCGNIKCSKCDDDQYCDDCGKVFCDNICDTCDGDKYILNRLVYTPAHILKCTKCALKHLQTESDDDDIMLSIREIRRLEKYYLTTYGKHLISKSE
jgi:hypothetical protein